MPPQQASCKACNACRARKVKCDGSRPRCETCVSRRSNCVYPLDGRYRRAGSPSFTRQQQSPSPRSPHHLSERPKSLLPHAEPRPHGVTSWENSLHNHHLCPLQTTALLRSQYHREMLREHIKVTRGFSVLSMTPLFPGRPHPHLERGDPQTE
jgi:hypothetical protein